MYGMSEYLMFAHEIERTRLLARKASKGHHREEWASPTGDFCQSYGRTREGADSYVIANGKIAAQTIHYTTEDERS